MEEQVAAGFPYGGIAQLGEHLPCKQGVKGSNPFISTEEWSKRNSSNTRIAKQFVETCSQVSLYLENRITNQSKVSKFANNDIKTSEAGTYENKIQKTKNDQSSATLGVKRLKASEVKAVIHRPLVYFISFASQMIRQRFA